MGWLDKAIEQFGHPARPHERGPWRTFWCPFHPDRRPGGRPNLRVNIENGAYVCMRCGAKGKLSGGKQNEMERNALPIVREALNNLIGSPAEDYLASRGIPPTIAQGVLGYWKGGTFLDYRMPESVMIPVWKAGRLARVKFRTISPRRSEDRYRGVRIWDGKAPLVLGEGRIALVVEGELDAVLLWRFYPLVIGMGGKAAELPVGLSMVLIPDNDEAGRSVEQSRQWDGIFHIAPIFKDVTDLWRAMGDRAIEWCVGKALEKLPFSPQRACLAASRLKMGRSVLGWATPMEIKCGEILISRNGQAEDEISELVGGFLARETCRTAERAGLR